MVRATIWAGTSGKSASTKTGTEASWRTRWGSGEFSCSFFAKKDRENIEKDELKAFKKLAKDYGNLKPTEIDRLAEHGELLEICHGC